RQETDEAGGDGRGATGGVPRGAQPRAGAAPMTTAGDGVRHLYVHLPFCAHRCGYCDFVTLVGRAADHGSYVDALLAELELQRPVLAPRLETIFLGGGRSEERRVGKGWRARGSASEYRAREDGRAQR